jgi:integrase
MDEYKAERVGKAAPVTINRELGVIKAFISYVVDRGGLQKNPFKSLDGKNLVKHLPSDERKIKFLSIKEIRALLSVCDETWRAVVTFALNTGLRRDEIRHLRWTSLDLSKAFISVESIGEFHTKSRRVRHIPLNDTALRVCGALTKRGVYVFGGVKPFMPGHFNHKFKALCTAAGLSGVGFHTLRHTFASHLVMAGVPIITVQALLGHSNVQTTMVYAHLSKDHKATAVNALDLSLSGPKQSAE